MCVGVCIEIPHSVGEKVEVHERTARLAKQREEATVGTEFKQMNSPHGQKALAPAQLHEVAGVRFDASFFGRAGPPSSVSLDDARGLVSEPPDLPRASEDEPLESVVWPHVRALTDVLRASEPGNGWCK